MTDNLTKEQRKKNMRNIRSKETSIENLLFKELKKFRLKISRNDNTILGRPDFVFKRKKVLVFSDSCFWHVCPYHANIPKSNKKYWIKKLMNNKTRDKKITKKLRKDGWVVLRFWEHKIKKEVDDVVTKIQIYLR